MSYLISPESTPPDTLDAITLSYRGIELHVYGILHGITGGGSRQYVSAVNRTIAQAPGLKLCEKSMKAMYRGLDKDMLDWFQIPFRDAYRIGFRSTCSPRGLWLLIRTILRERREQSPYGQQGVRMLAEMSSDPRIHSLASDVRRRLTGLPEPEDYLRLNLLRRQGKARRGVIFPDPDWEWLSYVEPYANIPLRSIHMVEFAVAYATRHQAPVVSLFLGEGHNTDIAWYVQARQTGTFPKDFLPAADDVVETANYAAESASPLRHLRYLLGLILGTSTSGLGYALITWWLLHLC